MAAKQSNAYQSISKQSKAEQSRAHSSYCAFRPNAVRSNTPWASNLSKTMGFYTYYAKSSRIMHMHHARICACMHARVHVHMHMHMHRSM